jgi:hypothetical protein
MMAIFLDRSDVKKKCAATCIFLPRKTTKDILIKSSQTNNLELPFTQMPI